MHTRRPDSIPGLSDPEIGIHAQAYIAAVVAGSPLTVAAFCGSALPDGAETSRRELAARLEALLRQITPRTSERYGISAETLAKFRRLRP